jgi:hypothetical protein
MRHPQKIRQHAPGVRNPARKALMIKREKFLEVARIVSPQYHRHDDL